MKKFLALILAIMLLFCITGCSFDNTGNNGKQLTQSGIENIVEKELRSQIYDLIESDPLYSDCDTTKSIYTILSIEHGDDSLYTVECKAKLYDYMDNFMINQYFHIYIEDGQVTNCWRDTLRGIDEMFN